VEVFEALREWFERRQAFRELRAIEEGGSGAFSKFFLIDVGPHDEAEALIREGRRRHPRFRSLYAAAFARVAFRRGDFEEALRRYEIVRRGFPQVADGYNIAAACLTELGRRDEAEAILERGVRKLPDDLDLCKRYAQAAERRLDWPEGLRRWKTLSDRLDEVVGFLGEAGCLKQMGRLDEAEVVLTDACERFRGNSWPFAELASLSTTKGDFAAAARRWEAVLQLFSGHEPAYLKAAEALRLIDREAEADEVLRVGMTRFFANLAINLEYARSAHRRGDSVAECERWALVLERFPACAEAREEEMAALAARARHTSSASR
jgi:predicted Zn-dependent protease